MTNTVHVCEDTNHSLDIVDRLAQAGYSTASPLNIRSISVQDPDAPARYISALDNCLGNFNTLSLVIDVGTAAGGVVQLVLNGVAVTAGAEIGTTDIQTGHLSYVPPSSAAGPVPFGFQVRHGGGFDGLGSTTPVAQCARSGLDLSVNYVNIIIPSASLGDRV